jgi:hypothetical protein
VRAASTDGPQRIRVRGKTHYILLPEDEYARLCHPRPRFLDFMAASPLKGLDLEITRDASLPPVVKL